MNIKVCSKCGQIKLDQIDFRILWVNNRFYYSGYCKDCERQYDLQYYHNNKQEINEKNKQYYKDNAEHRKHYDKQYYKDNAEHIKQYKKKWSKNNPEKVNAHSRKRRALKNGATGFHTEKDLHYIYENQKGKCGSCNVSLPYNQMTLDHIKPLSKGGSDLPYNIQLLCGSCNSAKGNYHATDYRNFEIGLLKNKSSFRLIFD